MKSSLAVLRQHLLPSLICFAIAYLLSWTAFFERIENVTLDERTTLRASLKPVQAAEDVVLVGIDEPSLQDFGRWPWNREVHGDFLRLIGNVKASVVAWDILFIDAAKEDAHMSTGILLGGANVVLGAMRAEQDLAGVTPAQAEANLAHLEPLPDVEGDRSRMVHDPKMALPSGELAKLASMGFVDTPRSADGVVRSAPMVVQIADKVYPTLSLRSLMEYWHAKPTDVHVRLGHEIEINTAAAKRRIPIDASGSYLINYRYATTGANNIGYSALTKMLFTKYVEKKPLPRPLPSLTGKILVVGQTADGSIDMGPTPFSELTPLVLVHVNIIDNVLKQDYVRRVPPLALWGGGILLGMAGLVRFSNRKLREQIVFAFGIPVAYTFTAVFLWMDQSRYLPMVGPMVGFVSLQVFMIGRRVLAEQRAKEQIKGMFGTYISPELVNRMVASGEAPRLGGHEEDITAYFSDIQGYSTFSEKLSPPKLVELLNEYLTACTDIVQEEGGTLDKYIGDAIVAMFGAPIKLPDHAYRACVAALRVQKRLDELRTLWNAQGDEWPDGVRKMRSRIGLNTGPAIIGNMGSRTRFNYTMTGDNVNLAARMESGAKSWGTYLMCTEATKLACEKHGGDRVVFRPLGKIVVKGRTQPVPVYEAADLKEFIQPATRECIRIFSEGLDRYYARDWEGALAKFRESLTLEPNQPGQTPGVTSNPSMVYIEIVTECQANPPPENWAGEYVMKEK